MANRGVNTLETNEASLTMKRNEREYAVDPLFHKRSAIFDSGGAKGLLLNVLASHNGYELVFDASDMVDDSLLPVAHAVGGEVESELRKMLTSMLPTNWQDAEICPEYAERQKGSSVALQQLLANEPEEPMDVTDYNDAGPRFDESIGMAVDVAPPHSGGDDSDDEDLAVHFGGGPAADAPSVLTNAASNDFKDYGGGDDDFGEIPMDLAGSSLLDAHLQRIEQKEAETDTMAQPDLDYYEITEGPNSEYTYFNRDKLSNWTGPEHWKHKSLKTQTGAKGKNAAQQDDEEYQDEEGNIIKTAKSRGPRKQFRIDFMSPAPHNLEELLASAGTSIYHVNHILPHVSSHSKNGRLYQNSFHRFFFVLVWPPILLARRLAMVSRGGPWCGLQNRRRWEA